MEFCPFTEQFNSSRSAEKKKDNRQLESYQWMYFYPCTLYNLLNLLYPYVYFVLVYTLGSFKSLLCLETLNSSNHTEAEFFFFFFFKFFTTLPPLRRFQNIGLSLGSYRILTDFFSSRYVNSSKKQWKSHWVSVEYYLFRKLWMLTLLGTLRSNDAHGDENVKKQ